MAWWLSWLERRPVTAEVVGSNPIRVAVFITEYFLTNGILAQLGEHLPYKQRVIGSSPIGPILQQEIVADFKIVQLQNVTDAGMPQWRNWQTHRT